MSKLRYLPLFCFAIFLIGYSCAVNNPEQIHLSPWAADSLMVTFVTIGEDPSGIACVKYSELLDGSDSSLMAYGASQFRWFNQTITPERWRGTFHRVNLSSLLPGRSYAYSVAVCESNDSSTNISVWSSTYHFRVPDARHDQFKVIFIADLGTYDNSKIVLARLEREILSNRIDLILIGGDITYSSRWETDPPLQSVENTFYNLFQPIGARVPVIAVAGNHERYYWNFAAYNLRIGNSNPKPIDRMYYSFDLNGVHFVGLSTEESISETSDQYLWFQQDKEAFLKRRSDTDWVVTFAHNPQYSSNLAHGSDLILRSHIEGAFQGYVNLALAGHEHAYERTLPVFNGQVSSNYSMLTLWDSDSADHFRDPPQPIHVLAGNCGATLYQNWAQPAPSWSRIRSSDYYGFLRLTFTKGNNSVTVESIDLANRTRDSFEISRQTSTTPPPTTTTSSATPSPTTPIPDTTTAESTTTVEETTTSPAPTSTSPSPTLEETSTAPLVTTTDVVPTTTQQQTATNTPTGTNRTDTPTPSSVFRGGAGFAMYVGGIVVMVILVVVVPLFVTVHLWCKKQTTTEHPDTELQGLANGGDERDAHVEEGGAGVSTSSGFVGDADADADADA